ncbi:MAG TPA: nucleotidyltransferase family protein [Mycobacteriales bacterium]|nr:nucleotidyltransferase family protein [Mycobacteriales bacterium]
MTNRVKIVGLVLAAGAGRRFGGPKALVELDGEPLVERVVRMLGDGGCDEVVVVLGAMADTVRDAAGAHTARFVVAEDWELGQGESLRAGLDGAAAAGADAVVVALVDQPWVGASAVRRLRDAAEAGAEAAVATYGGRPRNPVLLARSVWSEVSAAAVGDVGARAWLRGNPYRVVAVDCDGTGDPRDVDTPADLPE